MPMPPLDPDDVETLKAARAGDPEAGAALARVHGPSMLRTAWNVAGRYAAAEAEDMVQEAFIAALTTSALPTGDIGAWLRAITARKALDWLRQEARRRERSLPEPGEGAPEPAAQASAAAPFAVIAVRRALGKLSPLDRAVLTLVDLEGFSMAEAAGVIGSTTVAVKWRAVRARRRLRVAIEGEADARAGGSENDV